jgi:hypothetical protein
MGYGIWNICTIKIFFFNRTLCPCTKRPLKHLIIGTPEEIERLERTVEDYKSALAQQQVRPIVFYCIHINDMYKIDEGVVRSGMGLFYCGPLVED